MGRESGNGNGDVENQNRPNRSGMATRGSRDYLFMAHFRFLKLGFRLRRKYKKTHSL